MTVNYAQHLSTRNTPQTEKLPGTSQQANNAGGFSFVVDDWARLDRFLILGSEGGTYYVSERKLTKDNAEVVLRCAKVDALRTVNRVCEVSESGRAPKNDQAIFALALLISQEDVRTRQLASYSVPRVCRTAAHLYQFVEAASQMRGWGSAMHGAVERWLDSKEVGDLAYQAIKYQDRNGWNLSRLLRLVRPKTHPVLAPRSRLTLGEHKHQHVYGETTHPRSILYRWILKGWPWVGDEPHPVEELRQVWAMEKAKRATTKEEVVRLITDYRLTRECVQTHWLNEPSVWDALLARMPLTAMMRSLAKMTAVGLISPMSEASKKVAAVLSNKEALKKARVHPLAILLALKVYAQGRGDKGSLTWTPDSTVVDALDKAFYAAFDAVEPTGKNWFFGIDVSGSMLSHIAGTPLSCAEAAAALALVTAKVEPYHYVGGFTNGFTRFPVDKCQTLLNVLEHTRDQNFGPTDCSMPMCHAYQNKIPVDVFCVLTDSETYMGARHPSVELKEYRRKMGRNAKLVVVGMTSTGFTIADPDDAGMMDVVGFSPEVPAVMSNFAR